MVGSHVGGGLYCRWTLLVSFLTCGCYRLMHVWSVGNLPCCCVAVGVFLALVAPQKLRGESAPILQLAVRKQVERGGDC